MSVFRILLAIAVLAASTGCSQVRTVPMADLSQKGEVRDATVRTKSGEVYYFERARVAADTLSGFAQERRTVYLPGGDVQEVAEEHQVYVPVADVEQLSVKTHSWGRAGLWALTLGGVVGALAFVMGQSSQSSGQSGGGNYGPPGGGKNTQ